MKLLTIGGNTKILKSDKQGEYLTAILHLAPATLAGKEVCPGRSAGCTAACLNTAGRGQFASIQATRIKKTQWFFDERDAFLAQLKKELQAFVKRCAKLGVRPAVRLNGTSDLPWERLGIMEDFPMIQFYDYTKVALRFDPTWKRPSNYYLTFSLSESNEEAARRVLENGGNVAVVFRGGLPATYLGKPVVNGDLTDLRFQDPKNVVIGLTAKGRGKKDTTGFVREGVCG